MDFIPLNNHRNEASQSAIIPLIYGVMDQYRDYLDWIDSQAQHMAQLTYDWSLINSGSYHLEGLAEMHRVLSDNFLWLDGEMESIDLQPFTAISDQGEAIGIPVGQALRIRKRPEAPLRIFLGGHMDTVFGKGHPFQTTEFLDENTMNGPGVADLKGGLVVMLKALEALERSPWAEQIGWEIVINPDEEIGSRSSDVLFKEAAERNHLGLIYEPALEDGTLAGARKGSGEFIFVVRGRAAHAGREFDKGRNAIVAASELAGQLDALNGQRDGVTLNIGRIDGGGALNVVPDLAILRMNVRFVAVEDRAWVENAVDNIVNNINKLDGITCTPTITFTRMPKPMSEKNSELFSLVKASGDPLGLTIGWRDTGGCCDGNNLWHHGLPNVDTLGVRGGKIHSPEEYMKLDSLAERAKLSALLLMRLASDEVTLS